jgi:glucose/arabinose dehydrogenase
MVVVRVIAIVSLFGTALVACSGAFSTSLSPPPTPPAATATPMAVLSVASTPSRDGPSSTSVATAQASGQSTSPPTPGTVLLVDDRATANSKLVATRLVVPDGFRFPSETVRLPEGFSISLLAGGLASPRFMAFDRAGNLLVADQAGRVFRFPATNGTIAPTPSAPSPLLDNLINPSSLAIYDDYLYVGETNRITRYRYSPTGPPGQPEVVVPGLPTGGHSTRTVVFGPDGKLYVSVGSSCNICDESDERRAAILRYNPDGSGYQRFAWGLRNAVGLAFQPGTGLLWATVNERDNQGNEIPPDLVTIVRQGEDFGWPRCIPPRATPQGIGADCSGITPPTIGIQAHSAPLGLAFYTGTAFPAAYQSDLFVAQHGSWNRQPPAAPKILHIHFAQGRPVGAEDFATGWQRPDESRWGRPVGIIQAPDGGLIVSDDQAGVLYRIAYQAP